MARFRRSFRGRRLRRKSPYNVQRFSICRKAFNLGGETCDTATTDSVCLFAPGEDVAAALNPIIPGPAVDPVSKGVVVGGMRFFCEWSLNSDNIPADYADLITVVSMVAFIFKASVNPLALALPSQIPVPWHSSAGQGDRGQAANILWSQMWHLPAGWNDNTTSTYVLSSDGIWGYRDSTIANAWGLQAGTGGAPRINRVKTKRTLGEFDALFFGVSAVTGVNTIQPLPIAFDVMGQLAIKRSRKTTL